MNESLFYYLNGLAFQSEILDTLFVFGAFFLPSILVLALALFAVFEFIRRRGALERIWVGKILFIVLAPLAAWLLSEVVKHFYPVARPFEALPNVKDLFRNFPSSMDAFPSSHATLFGALATTLLFYHRRLAYFYILGALLIGLSRVIVGVHWPLDILSGYLLGGAVVLGVHYSLKKGRI